MSGVPRQVWVLVVGVFLVMIGISLVAPIIPLYAREFGVSRTAAGALISVFAAARLVFDLFGGVMADRVGARRVMLGGALLVTASSVSAALAPDYGVLLISRFFEGAGTAAFALSAMQYLILTTPKARLGRTIALFQTGLLGGAAIGPIVGGYAAELGDFTTPFWVYAGLGVLVAILAGVFVEGTEPSGIKVSEMYRSAGKLLRNRGFLALLVVTFALFVMRAGARFTLLPLYAGEELGLGEGQIGQIIAASAIVNVGIVNFAGALVDRVGRRPVLVVGLLLNGLGVAAYAAADTYLALLAVSVVFGLTTTLASIPPPTLAGDLAPPGAEGASIGLYRTAGDIGFIVGPLLLGSIAEQGRFDLGFVLTGALLFIAAAVALTIPETKQGAAGARGPVVREGP
jgi:MFS family permease